MRGVILEGELYGHAGGEPERVIAFVELDDDVLHVRRGYGGRAAVLSVELDAVDAALAALKAERARRPPEPIPGQLDLDGSEDPPDNSDAT